MVALLGFTAVLVAASGAGLVAGRLRPRPETPASVRSPLAAWALGGGENGTLATWFLLGGSIFTAYTFVAVPALVYGVGGLGFFAVPYTIVVFQLAYLVLPALWRRAAVHGWLTPADVVRDRFGSPALALAVALTGLLATMPYIALQLLGLGALLSALGVAGGGVTSDLALTATFAVLAVGTYRHGLRTPTVVAVVKGVLIFAAAGVLAVAVLHRARGARPVFEGAAAALAGTPGAGLVLPPQLASSYVTLALGSAVALLLYPHVLLPSFAARDAGVLRRNAVALLAWTALLGLLALGGLAALSSGVTVPPGHAELAVPRLVREVLPDLPAGLVLGAVGVGALVPAAVMSVAAASGFASNVYLEYVNPRALPEQVRSVARTVSVLVKLGAVAFVLGLRTQDAISLQLLGGVWILQTLPAVLLGLAWRWVHRYALLAGLVTGVVAGTWLCAAQGFVAVTAVTVGGWSLGVYAGIVALGLNLAVAVLLTPLLNRWGISRGTDSTWSSARGTLRSEWEASA
ncbi:MAG TPA: sodium:solute symporter [Kineosporiaceae bacterium]|nr:sodium:solute symporter [Kineosporiaceae bacterium]